MFRLIFLTLLIALPFSAVAQNKNTVQIGEIILNQDDTDIEDIDNTTQQGFIELQKEEKKEAPYDVIQKDAIDFLQQLYSTTKQQNQIGSKKLEPSDPKIIEYIATSYLLCSIKKGACKEFLDTLLEIDFINSMADSSEPKCLTLNQFWKAWENLDMQKKLDHQSKINQIQKRNTFKKTVVPNFVSPKCEDLVFNLMNQSKSDKTGFFKKRYEKNSPAVKSIAFTTKMLIYLKNKNIDVYGSTIPR